MRCLIAIGCDEYDHPELSPLAGAVNDARSIFNHLVTDGLGDYDPSTSSLLSSPTLAEVNSAISAMLFDAGPLDELTIFFAGHGGTKDDAYFMCLRDTQVNRISVTALGMSSLFSWLNEAKVQKTNIVIDACQSGGVTRDIATLLNPNIVGKVGSPSISILAASASDENALEVGGRGLCTAAVLRCLTGELVVQTTRQTLDLVEIGRAVSAEFEGMQQSPVSWGLNLYGRSQFARNPRLTAGAASAIDSLAGQHSDPELREYLEGRHDAIWEFYLSLPRGFDALGFLELVRPILEHISAKPVALAKFTDGVASTFSARLEASQDSCDVMRFYAAAIVSLLPHMASSAGQAITDDLTLAFCERAAMLCDTLVEDLEAQQYSLLAARSGHADLFFLPLRVLNLLGWISAGSHIAHRAGRPELLDAEKFRHTVGKVIQIYMPSIVAISDEQAAGFLPFLTEALRHGMVDEAEQVTCLLFNTYIENSGNIAYAGVKGSGAFDLMWARLTGDYTGCDEILAKPTALLAALLLAYGALGIADVADLEMRELDYTNMNMFIPKSYLDFGLEHIDEGHNHTLQIGHHIWRVKELERHWENLASEIQADYNLALCNVRGGALLASMLRPDRQAWFMVSSWF